MLKKAITRRIFARSAAVGVPLAIKKPIDWVPTGGMVSGIGAPEPMSIGDVAKQTFMSKVFKALRSGVRSHEERRNTRYGLRIMMGGLDPDLAVLNSMSLARRARIQMDRDRSAMDAENSLRNKIIRSMGGNPEDFE